jgi:hypothetical protein
LSAAQIPEAGDKPTGELAAQAEISGSITEKEK